MPPHDQTGGMLLVFALGEGMRSPSVKSFTLGSQYRVNLRPQAHLTLPVKAIRKTARCSPYLVYSNP